MSASVYVKYEGRKLLDGGDGDVGLPRAARVGQTVQQRGLEILALSSTPLSGLSSRIWTLGEKWLHHPTKLTSHYSVFKGCTSKWTRQKVGCIFVNLHEHRGADTGTGRGVFATKIIPAKTVIEVCPVLILGLEENKAHIEHTSLYHYT